MTLNKKIIATLLLLPTLALNLLLVVPGRCSSAKPKMTMACCAPSSVQANVSQAQQLRAFCGCNFTHSSKTQEAQAQATVSESHRAKESQKELPLVAVGANLSETVVVSSTSLPPKIPSGHYATTKLFTLNAAFLI